MRKDAGKIQNEQLEAAVKANTQTTVLTEELGNANFQEFGNVNEKQKKDRNITTKYDNEISVFHMSLPIQKIAFIGAISF